MKHKYLIAALIAFGCMTLNASAVSCGYEEKAKLNSEAGNVKANYEIKERVLDPSEYSLPDSLLGASEEEIAAYKPTADYMQVNILNLTENLYAEVTRDIDNDTKRYTYNDSLNGNVSFIEEDLSNIVKYTIKIYSSSNTSCEGNVLKTLYVVLPRYNYFSEYSICEKIPDFYLCQKYVTSKKVSYGEFFNQVQKEAERQNVEVVNNEKKDKWYEEVGNFVNNHKIAFIIGGITVVVLAGGVTFVIIRKCRGKNI